MYYRRIDGVNRYFDTIEAANKAAGVVVISAPKTASKGRKTANKRNKK